MGLVETLVGVVPGGGGVKEMLYRWYARHGDINKAAWDTFMNTGYGRTARSPLEAAPLAMYRPGRDTYLMNRDHLLREAIDSVGKLATSYKPGERQPLAMPGTRTWQQMREWLDRAHAKGQLSAHDVTTGSEIAMIVTGGDVDEHTVLSDSEICALERKAFLTLARTAETRARIEQMLHTGRPLRN
jgi:3-hydroxyacyl-CoA dehydrogenase